MKTKFYFLLFIIALISCKNDKKDSNQATVDTKQEISNNIEIITRSMEFDMADTIPSGWNTFVYDNRASETHFFRFVKLPEGITVDNYKNEADPVFEEGMDLINEGKTEEGFAVFGKMPEWFSKSIPSGGSGLIAPKHNQY